ncbi:MAG TPA: acylphosphatase [Ignavibacteria bacterium]|nr:acylphosphatase [Ignavibacteria bacterium]
MKRYAITVKGLVQGVGFRYFTLKKAVSYGLKGYVRNLHNGNVEIEVEGDEGLINDFMKDLKIGPRSSKVADLVVLELELTGKYEEFEIK